MLSTCAKCGGHLFEMEVQSPAKANYKVFFVQCLSCGVPISSMPYLDISSQIDELKSGVGDLESRINNVNIILQDIQRKIR